MSEYQKICSVIVPCKNEAEALPIYYESMCRVIREMAELQFEFWFIDDGSSDQTLEWVKTMRKENPQIHYISFSRNFGKEAAIYAGLKHVKGDYTVIMDADLQDPPDLLPEMYRAVRDENYDCAVARRVTRKGEPPIRSFFARMFYRLMNRMSQVELVDGARDFRLMSRAMVDSILELKEYNRFSKGIFGWVGFRTKWIPFENVTRCAGETKWSFWKLFCYSIEGIVAFSTAPLAIASFLGILFCIFSFIGVLFIFFRALIFGDPVAGWPSTICIITLLSGIQLLCMGIMGIYLSKTYLETKNRPIYIVKEKE